MGVKGLWRLLEEAGTPVTLESLENKILAVDVSIWLHQAVHGYKGLGSDTTANAHLLTLFHRICKLLFYRVRPVFIFDGGVPQLKKQTLSFRRVRREAAADRAQEVRQRLLKNLLKSHAVRNVLGRTGPTPNEHRVLPPVKPRQKDMFELPPLPEGVTLDVGIEMKTEDDEESTDTAGKSFKCHHSRVYQNLHDFDLDSEEFLSLPLQKRHEVLVELQDSRKDNSWGNLNHMPADFDDFSSFQMKRLLKRSKFQETIDTVRSTIQKEKSEEIEREMFGDLEKHVGQTHRIVSEDAAHTIVMRKIVEEEKQTDDQVAEPKATRKEKGKSLMKNPKDFLTELVNKGVIDNSDEDSDSDIANENIEIKKEQDLENNSLLDVMNYIMEDDNGISQDEIMTIIQQTSDEIDEIMVVNNDENKPSTSANASGTIAFQTASSDESDDDDDFIEVPLEEEIESSLVKEKSMVNSSQNIDAIMSSSSNSLYLKIVQHRLDDVLHTSEMSPKKALVDSRKKVNNDLTDFGSPKKDIQYSPGKEPKLSLNFDLSKVDKVDDLFADIFRAPEPQKISNEKLVTKNLQSKPDIIELDDVEMQNSIKQKVNDMVKQQIENMLKKSVIQIPSETDETNENVMPSSEDDDDFIDVEPSHDKTDYSNHKTQPDNCGTDFSKQNNVAVQVAQKDILKKSNEILYSAEPSSSSSQVNNYDCLLPSTSNQKITSVISPDISVTSGSPEESQLTMEIQVPRSPAGEHSHSEKIFQAKVSHPPTIDELKSMESKLVDQQQTLVAQVNKSDRIASSLSQQTYTDAQELLQLFGLPYLVAPMEAEAQCAFLDVAGLTNGTITDDSDAFLFGSKHVYKNFFNQNKHMEYFKAINLQHRFGLDRERLICLALLTGSDYTEGIDGVGAVSAMEILTEFPGKGVEILKTFKKWWVAHSRGVSAVKMTKLREKWVKLHVPESFPNQEIFNAYIEPTVDESKEKFDWVVPNIEAIRDFTAEKFGWSKLKTDEILLPVMKRLKVNSSQTRIDSFFHNVTLVKESKIQSKRLKEAIAKSKGEVAIGSSISQSKPKNKMDEIKNDHINKQNRKRTRDASTNLTKRVCKVKHNSDQIEQKDVDDDPDLIPVKILSKEEQKLENYKNLYKREEISQRKADELSMTSKKQKAAALLLKKKMESSKKTKK